MHRTPLSIAAADDDDSKRRQQKGQKGGNSSIECGFTESADETEKEKRAEREAEEGKPG